jgi:hypothetical protein
MPIKSLSLEKIEQMRKEAMELTKKMEEQQKELARQQQLGENNKFLPPILINIVVCACSC